MIDVVLVTWPNHPKRIEYFRRTLTALQFNLSASRHKLRWLCSAESERDPASTWHGDDLERLCAENEIGLAYRNGPASLGSNMNAAARLCTAPVHFIVQDDYELLYPLDLSPGADFMLAHSEVDLLRYSYFQHPEHGTKFFGNIDGWRQVNIGATWPYGDDPQMRRRDFHEKWGWYSEGGPHGTSEGDMLWRLVSRRATICAADRSYFGHFGEIAAVPLDREHRPRAVSR